MRVQSTLMMISASSIALAFSTGAYGQAQAPNLQPPSPTANPGQPADSSEEIVVTASRRTERLRDVPSAVTALAGDKLNQIGARDATSYLTLVPGVSFRDTGTPGQGTMIIRGLNSGTQQVTNTAATYIDDAPFSASGFLSAGAFLNPDPDVADLDHLEILKGPQGTLYGANSLGGLVRIVSKHPELNAVSAFGRIEGSVTSHGSPGQAFDGNLNVPLINDQLALRVNGVYRYIGGFVDNVATGDNDFNWSVIKGGRASLRWKPVSNLTIDLSGMLQDIHNNGTSIQQNVSGTLQPLYGRYKYSGHLKIPSDLRYRLAYTTIDYDFGPVALIATGSYARYQTHNLGDYTNNYYAYARFASPAFAAVLPANGNGLGNFSPNMKKWTAEVRAVSKRLGRFEFVAGGFYTNEHNIYDTTIIATDANGDPLPGNFRTGVPLKNLVVTRTLSNYQEFAGFLNGTFYIADNFDVGGGIRYAHNDQTAATGARPDADTFYTPRATRYFKFSDNVPTYLATLRYRPTSRISMYLRAASGYRPGGPQTNPSPPAGAQTSVRPDTTWNYEGGVKASAGIFSIDASVFHIDWNDIQLNTLYGGVVLGANGGKAKVDGFEAALTARPAPLTSLSANVGYTNARMTQVDPGVQAYVGVRPNDKLPLTPAWTVALIADQGIPLGGGVKGDIGATVRYRSDFPSSFPHATADPSIRIPSVTTVDLRAGATFGRYNVQLRAENLFDAFGYYTVSTPRLYATQQVPTNATLIRPRTVTLSFSVRY